MGESPTAHIKAVNKRFAFCKVTTIQVERVMKALIKSKATGIHNIPNKILKDSYQVIAPFLSEIFNCAISTNVFPDDLKIGKVSPVHKSNDIDNLNNYRPISVLPTIARVFLRDYCTTRCTFTLQKINCWGSSNLASDHSTQLHWH